MKVSIVIPAYNEENAIQSTLESIVSFVQKQKYDWEVIVVEDGSTDRTLEILKTFISKARQKDQADLVDLTDQDDRFDRIDRLDRHSRKITSSRKRSSINKIRIIQHSTNRGKGAAVKTGMLKATGDYMYLCDTDLSAPIEELAKFLKYKDYDIVVGSRAIEGAKVKTSIPKRILGRLGSLLINLFIIRGIKDTQCGFKLFSKRCKKLFKLQTIERWGYDFEILFLARRAGFRIKEIPIKWTIAKISRVKPLDYFRTLYEIFLIRWNDLKGIYNNSNT